MKSLILASLALGLSAGSAAADWRPSGIGHGVAIAIDQSSIRADGQTRTFWTVSAYDIPDDRGYDYVLARQRIDCAGVTAQPLTMVFRRLDQGGVPDGGDFIGPVSSIIPESVGFTNYEAVCNGDWPDEFVFETALDFVEDHRRFVASE